MRAAIYKRVSVTVKESVSLTVQEDRLRAYAESQGWTVVKVYEDAGISGGSMDRPALQQMLEDAKLGMFDSILVYKLDRLSRSTRDFHELANYLDQHKVSLVSVTQHLDTSSPTGRLLRNILVDFANFEREIIRERIIDNKTHRATLGHWNGGKAPFGYIKKDKKLYLHPEESRIIRQIYDDYLSGAYSFRQISKKYKLKLGHVTFIFRNPIYAGKVGWRKTSKRKGYFKRHDMKDWILADGDHEAIVTWEEFLRAQEIKKANDKIPKERYERQVFKDLCYCGECGTKMYFFHTPRKLANGDPAIYQYYRCYAYNRVSDIGCRKVSSKSISIENAVLNVLGQLVTSDQLWEEALKINESGKVDSAKLKSKLEREYQANIKKIDNLIEELSNNKIRKYVAKKIEEIEDRQHEIQAEIAELGRVSGNSSDTREIIKDVIKVWKSLTAVEKCQSIRLVLKRIDVWNDKIALHWNDKHLPVMELPVG